MAIKDYQRTKTNIEKKKLEINRLKEMDRKARARRLIQKGALLEKYFEIEDLSIEETEQLLERFSSFVKKNK